MSIYFRKKARGEQPCSEKTSLLKPIGEVVVRMISYIVYEFIKDKIGC